MRSVRKKYALTLLVRKEHAVARVIRMIFAVTLYVWRTYAPSERNMT